MNERHTMTLSERYTRLLFVTTITGFIVAVLTFLYNPMVRIFNTFYVSNNPFGVEHLMIIIFYCSGIHVLFGGIAYYYTETPNFSNDISDQERIDFNQKSERWYKIWIELLQISITMPVIGMVLFSIYIILLSRTLKFITFGISLLAITIKFIIIRKKYKKWVEWFRALRIGLFEIPKKFKTFVETHKEKILMKGMLSFVYLYAFLILFVYSYVLFTGIDLERKLIITFYNNDQLPMEVVCINKSPKFLLISLKTPNSENYKDVICLKGKDFTIDSFETTYLKQSKVLDQSDKQKIFIYDRCFYNYKIIYNLANLFKEGKNYIKLRLTTEGVFSKDYVLVNEVDMQKGKIVFNKQVFNEKL